MLNPGGMFSTLRLVKRMSLYHNQLVSCGGGQVGVKPVTLSQPPSFSLIGAQAFRLMGPSVLIYDDAGSSSLSIQSAYLFLTTNMGHLWRKPLLSPLVPTLGQGGTVVIEAEESNLFEYIDYANLGLGSGLIQLSVNIGVTNSNSSALNLNVTVQSVVEVYDIVLRG